MPARKDTSSDPAGDTAKAEVQEAMDEAHDKGYIGFAPDPNPNKAYTLLTGPDSPTAAESVPTTKEG